MFRRWVTPSLSLLSDGNPSTGGAPITLQAPPIPRVSVPLKSVLATEHFSVNRTSTSVGLGVDSLGVPVYLDIADMPHMLIAGAAGSGKSVALNTLVTSALFCASPKRVRFIFIDPKRVELAVYNGLPHNACPVLTDTKDILKALAAVCDTIDRRYKRMARLRQKLTTEARIVIVVDELADLMLTSKKTVEPLIVRISQIGRAAGVHLIAATQKPLVSVVTGLIQANLTCKLALQTASAADSVRILGKKGAEKLTGRGDALLKLPDRVEPFRMQCAYTCEADTQAVVRHWRSAR